MLSLYLHTYLMLFVLWSGKRQESVSTAYSIYDKYLHGTWFYAVADIKPHVSLDGQLKQAQKSLHTHTHTYAQHILRDNVEAQEKWSKKLFGKKRGAIKKSTNHVKNANQRAPNMQNSCVSLPLYIFVCYDLRLFFFSFLVYWYCISACFRMKTQAKNHV